MDSEEEGDAAGIQRSGVIVICGTGSNATRYVSRPGEAFRVSINFGGNGSGRDPDVPFYHIDFIPNPSRNLPMVISNIAVVETQAQSIDIGDDGGSTVDTDANQSADENTNVPPCQGANQQIAVQDPTVCQLSSDLSQHTATHESFEALPEQQISIQSTVAIQGQDLDGLVWDSEDVTSAIEIASDTIPVTDDPSNKTDLTKVERQLARINEERKTRLAQNEQGYVQISTRPYKRLPRIRSASTLATLHQQEVKKSTMRTPKLRRRSLIKLPPALQITPVTPKSSEDTADLVVLVWNGDSTLILSRREKCQLGSFAALYHNTKFDRYGRDINVDYAPKAEMRWRLADIFRLILPYLSEAERSRVMTLSSSIFELCQQAVCLLVERKNPNTAQWESVRMYLQRAKKRDGPYPQLRHKDPKELVSIVTHRGLKRAEFNNKRQHFSVTNLSLVQIVEIESELKTRALDDMKLKMETILKKVRFVSDERREQILLTAMPCQRSGIAVLEFRGVANLRPQHLFTSGMREFQNLMELGIYMCEQFKVSEFPANYESYRNCLGKGVQLFWSMAKPALSQFDMSVYKPMAIGAWLFQASHLRVEYPDVNPGQIPLVKLKLNWIKFLGFLENFLSTKKNRDGTEKALQYDDLNCLERQIWKICSTWGPNQSIPGTIEAFRASIRAATLSGAALEMSYNMEVPLPTMLFGIKSGHFSIDTFSNAATKWFCGKCQVWLHGIFFANAQIMAMTKSHSKHPEGVCYGCRWVELEEDAVEMPPSSAGRLREQFENFVRQRRPKTFEEFLEFDPRNDRVYGVSTPATPLVHELQKGYTKTTARDPATVEPRRHLFIKSCCKFGLVNEDGTDKCTLRTKNAGEDPEMIARAETHEAGFCHNMRLRESYLACTEPMRRYDHERGVLNPRYSRESTDVTDVVDYLREDDNSMPEGVWRRGRTFVC